MKDLYSRSRISVPLTKSLLALSLILILASPSTHATLVSTGDVFPAGLGPGDTTTSATISINTGSIFIDAGTTLTADTIPFVNIGRVAGSTGEITVKDAGSKLRVEGATVSSGAFLTVGRSGNGTLIIDNGAKVEIDSLGAPAARQVPGARFPAGFQAGRDSASKGTINISGLNSELSVASDFAFGSIGREGEGTMNITGGGKLTFSGINSDLNISSDLFTPSNSKGTLNVNTGSSISGPVFMDVGGSRGGHGIVNLDGNTSAINLSGACTLDCPPGYSYPGQGAFLTVGANEGKGEVHITNGAKFTIDSSTAPHSTQAAGFAAGGSPILGPIGDGKIVVDGAGSELRVIGDKGFFSVGRLQNGTGELSISNGGKVIMENGDGNSKGFVGDATGATGIVTVDGANSVLDAGNFLGVGVTPSTLSPGGDGHIILKNGGTLLADNIHIDNGGTIKGNGTLAGSTGNKTQVRTTVNGIIDSGLSPGTIIIDGDLIMDGGTLMLEAFSSTNMDQIIVTGDAIFNSVVIDIILSYTPTASDILNFFNVQGNFTINDTLTSINTYAAPGSGAQLGASVIVDIGGQQIVSQIQSVPEPTSILLIGLGLAGIRYNQRKKAA